MLVIIFYGRISLVESQKKERQITVLFFKGKNQKKSLLLMKKTLNKKEIIEKITPVIENTGVRYNLIPLEISFEKENGRWFLRIYIYSLDHPVNHKDCENISHSLGDLLDDIIPFKYYLEVSSPGLDKRLKSKLEYQIFKGHSVIVKVKNPVEPLTSKTFKGRITDYNDAYGLKVAVEDLELEIPLDNIFSVRLNDIEEI